MALSKFNIRGSMRKGKAKTADRSSGKSRSMGLFTAAMLAVACMLPQSGFSPVTPAMAQGAGPTSVADLAEGLLSQWVRAVVALGMSVFRMTCFTSSRRPGYIEKSRRPSARSKRV